MWIQVANLVTGSVDAVLMRQSDFTAAAEQVRFLQFNAGRIFAAGSTVLNSRLERPDIAGAHFEIDDAVVISDRPNLRIEQIAVAAQNALAFPQQSIHVEIA